MRNLSLLLTFCSSIRIASLGFMFLFYVMLSRSVDPKYLSVSTITAAILPLIVKLVERNQGFNIVNHLAPKSISEVTHRMLFQILKRRLIRFLVVLILVVLLFSIFNRAFILGVGLIILYQTMNPFWFFQAFDKQIQLNLTPSLHPLFCVGLFFLLGKHKSNYGIDLIISAISGVLILAIAWTMVLYSTRKNEVSPGDTEYQESYSLQYIGYLDYLVSFFPYVVTSYFMTPYTLGVLRPIQAIIQGVSAAILPLQLFCYRQLVKLPDISFRRKVSGFLIITAGLCSALILPLHRYFLLVFELVGMRDALLTSGVFALLLSAKLNSYSTWVFDAYNASCSKNATSSIIKIIGLLFSFLTSVAFVEDPLSMLISFYFCYSTITFLLSFFLLRTHQNTRTSLKIQLIK